MCGVFSAAQLRLRRSATMLFNSISLSGSMRAGPDFGVEILNVIGGSCSNNVVVISWIFDTAVLVSGRVVTVFVRSLQRHSCWLRADSEG